MRNKMIIITILIIGVSVISIGLATFSSLLNINSNAQVSPNPANYKVSFSCSKDKLEECEVSPSSSNSSILANSPKAIIDNSGSNPTLTNLSATFTNPEQIVYYSFYAYNNGNYDAYFKGIRYKNVPNTSSTIICTALEGATDSLVQAACKDINITINAGNVHYTNFPRSEKFVAIADFDNDPVLEKNSFRRISINLRYDPSYTNIRADGPFEVEFGDISLEFSTTPN